MYCVCLYFVCELWKLCKNLKTSFCHWINPPLYKRLRAVWHEQAPSSEIMRLRPSSRLSLSVSTRKSNLNRFSFKFLDIVLRQHMNFCLYSSASLNRNAQHVGHTQMYLMMILRARLRSNNRSNVTDEFSFNRLMTHHRPSSDISNTVQLYPSRVTCIYKD